VVHLLLTDVVMPRMSGGQLAREALLVHAAHKTLFVSGHTDDEVLEQAVRGGAFLPKPYSSSALLAKVRQVLG
jgi:FixJ family two-component response regulator